MAQFIPGTERAQFPYNGRARSTRFLVGNRACLQHVIEECKKRGVHGVAKKSGRLWAVYPECSAEVILEIDAALSARWTIKGMDGQPYFKPR